MGAPLVVDCPSCGTTLKFRASGADSRTVKCPSCSVKFVVEPQPASDDEWLTGDVNEEAEDDSHVERRPLPPVSKKKPAARRRKPLSVDRRVVAAAVGVMLLFAAILLKDRLAPAARQVGAALSKAGSALNSDPTGNQAPGSMTWLSDFTQTLIRVRVARLLASPEWKTFPRRDRIEAKAAEIIRPIGLELAEIESFMVGDTQLLVGGSKTLAANVDATVIRLVNAVDQSAWKARLTGAGGRFDERRVHGVPVLVVTNLGVQSSCYFVDSRTVVVASFDYLTRAIPKQGRCAAQPRFEGLTGEPLIEFGLAPQTIETAYDFFRGTRIENKPSMFAVTLDADNGFTLSMLSRFQTEQIAAAQADNLAEPTRLMGRSWEAGWAEASAALSATPQKETVSRLVQSASDSLQKAQSSVRGNLVEMSLHLPSSIFHDAMAIAAAPEQFAGLMPAAAKAFSSSKTNPFGMQTPADSPQPAAAAPAPVDSPFIAIPDSDWKLLRLPEYAVSVESPGELPVEEAIDGPGSYKLRVFRRRREKDSFEVFVTVFPDNIREKMTASGRPITYWLAYWADDGEKRIDAAPATVESTRDIQLGPHTGRESVCRTNGTRRKVVRCFVTDRYKWVLEYQFDAGLENIADRDRFFESLQLIPAR